MAAQNAIKVVVCDIEGTTTSISFVKDTLFPFALKHVEAYLRNNWTTDAVKNVVSALRTQSIDDVKAELDGAVPVADDDKELDAQIVSIVDNVKWQIGNDRKATPLKTLQGLIWEQGYKDNELKGHVYADVPKAFDLWTSSTHNAKIYIYSSGSVQAQKLIFGNSDFGDLTPKLTGYYDTEIGMKQDKNSYSKIIAEIGCLANEILFLTDVVKEAAAAKEAGMQVQILVRPGNVPLTDDERNQYKTVSTFDDIILDEVVAKRKIDDEAVEERPTKIPKIDCENSSAADNANKKNDETEHKLDDLKTASDDKKIDATMSTDKAEPATTTIINVTNTNGDSKLNDNSDKMDVDEVNVDDAKKLDNDIIEKTDVTEKNSNEQKTVEIVGRNVENVSSVSTAEHMDVDVADNANATVKDVICDLEKVAKKPIEKLDKNAIDAPVVEPIKVDTNKATIENGVGKDTPADQIVAVNNSKSETIENTDKNESSNDELKSSAESNGIAEKPDDQCTANNLIKETLTKTDTAIKKSDQTDDKIPPKEENIDNAVSNISEVKINEAPCNEKSIAETTTKDDVKETDEIKTTKSAVDECQLEKNEVNVSEEKNSIEEKVDVVEKITDANESPMVTDGTENVTATQSKETPKKELEIDMEKSLPDKDADGKKSDETAPMETTKSNENVETAEIKCDLNVNMKASASVLETTETKNNAEKVDKLEKMETDIVIDVPEKNPEKTNDCTSTEATDTSASLKNASNMETDDIATELPANNSIINKSSTTDDIPVPIVKCATSTSSSSNNTNIEDTKTIQKTEISEIIETTSPASKEKKSRVEITIEQTDSSESGQTTQTTTHIVKEISITEQKHCGKIDVTENCDGKTKEMAVNEIDCKNGISNNNDDDEKLVKRTVATTITIPTTPTEIVTPLLSSSSSSHTTTTNGKLNDNSTEKNGNDSDKENEIVDAIVSTTATGAATAVVSATNGDDNKDSLCDNSIVAKKCVDLLVKSPAAAHPSTITTTTNASMAAASTTIPNSVETES